MTAPTFEATVKKTPRELYREQLRENLEVKAQEIASGPLEGEKVVLLSDVRWALGEPFPPVSDHGAEVATPARVIVWATCPRCGQPGVLSVEITPELRVDSTGGSLHLKAKSKPVTHICGQMPLSVGPDGQSSFELGDVVAFGPADEAHVGPIIGEVEGGYLEVADPHNSANSWTVEPNDAVVIEPGWEKCPGPYCVLAVEHKGDHIGIKPKTDDSEDILADRDGQTSDEG